MGFPAYFSVLEVLVRLSRFLLAGDGADLPRSAIRNFTKGLQVSHSKHAAIMRSFARGEKSVLSDIRCSHVTGLLGLSFGCQLRY